MIKIIKTEFLFYFLAILFGSFLTFAINTWLTDSASLSVLQAKEKNVLDNVKIVEKRIEGEFAFIHITGEKVRSDCGAPLSLSGYYGQPLKPFTTVKLVKDISTKEFKTTPYTERPAIEDQVQDFGWWAISPIPGGEFYLYIEYLCGRDNFSEEPYLKKNVVGPFVLE